MNSYQSRSEKGQQQAASSEAGRTNGKASYQLKDNRPISKKKQIEALNGLPSQAVIVQKKANNTGLPDGLKSGIENLSGHSLDDVKVHYNSSQPAQLNAHAYAQGTNIHLAPGQEKHLPHEAWHVVQQKQGRVKPTMQMKGKVQVNDDEGLEREADLMGKKALQRVSKTQELTSGSLQNTDTEGLPIQLAKKEASVQWGITHIVELTNKSLFGEGEGLDNEVKPSEGGQLKKGDELIIDDAPVLISRRGSNQEKKDKRAEDEKGNKVYEWVRVLEIIPQKGLVRVLGGAKMYVRKETITIVEKKVEKPPEGRNNISIQNIKDWDKEGIPGELTAIAEKWKQQGKLRRTKSRGVLDIDKKDMKKVSKGGLEKPSGRYWDQFDEGVNVATDMAEEEHEPFEEEQGQWRIKAVNEETKELVGVLIVEKRKSEPLYLRWLIGNPEIKGGGSALLAAVKKILLENSEDAVEVTSAYSAKESYTKSGFEAQNEARPGEEFTLLLRKDAQTAASIPKEHTGFKPEKYAFKKKESDE